MQRLMRIILNTILAAVFLVIFGVGFIFSKEAFSWSKTRVLSSTYCAFQDKSKCIDELIARGHQAKRDADLAWAAERELILSQSKN